MAKFFSVPKPLNVLKYGLDERRGLPFWVGVTFIALLPAMHNSFGQCAACLSGKQLLALVRWSGNLLLTFVIESFLVSGYAGHITIFFLLWPARWGQVNCCWFCHHSLSWFQVPRNSTIFFYLTALVVVQLWSDIGRPGKFQLAVAASSVAYVSVVVRDCLQSCCLATDISPGFAYSALRLHGAIDCKPKYQTE